MKKILALVLAAAMVFSMVCFASAANFTDADEITISNSEAVTILSEMGIIAGMGDGKFAPNDTLTRAQAAKIICYMLLGKTGAEALTADKANFTDVPTGNWACKYVNYCADKGIVAGIGSGKFGPNNKLTGYAFAKMLLCGAAGFDAAGNGLTGNDWESNTKKLLTENNLSTNVTVTSKDLNRQDACHLALNFLFYKEADDPSETLAFKTFGITRMGGELNKDNLMRPTTTYSTEQADICWPGNDIVVDASPVYVGTGKLPCKDIVKGLGGAEPTSANMVCYRNGVLSKTETLDSTPLTADNSKPFVCSGDGVYTEFYYDATVPGGQYTCIMAVVHAGKITAVTEPDISSTGAVLSAGTVTIEVGGQTMTCASNSFKESDVGGYALYYYKGEKSWSEVKEVVQAWKAKTATGKLTSEDDTVKVGGKTYATLLIDSGMQGNSPIPYTGAMYLANGGAVGDEVTLILNENNMCFGIVKD